MEQASPESRREQFLAPEFDALAEELFTAALGRGLLHLPKFALPEAAEER